ncbi:still frameshift probable transcriptional regulator [Pseudomonas aeruginosa NCMG1179]|nr:still frameshift probable transcriptional regulator [Pseudomonas aeruginosa NCMG1179]
MDDLGIQTTESRRREAFRTDLRLAPAQPGCAFHHAAPPASRPGPPSARPGLLPAGPRLLSGGAWPPHAAARAGRQPVDLLPGRTRLAGVCRRARRGRRRRPAGPAQGPGTCLRRRLAAALEHLLGTFRRRTGGGFPASAGQRPAPAPGHAAAPAGGVRCAAGAASPGPQPAALHPCRAPVAGPAHLAGGASGAGQPEIRTGAGHRRGAGADARAPAR